MASGDVVFQHPACDVQITTIGGGSRPGNQFSFVLTGENSTGGNTSKPDNVTVTFDGSWALGDTFFVSQIVDPLKTYDVIVKEH